MEGTARFERTLARVLHVTSNGHGMGHLSRQAAIALSDADPAEHAIASLSTAAPLLRGLGLRSEYIAGFDRGQIPRARWDAYLRDRLGALVDLTGARVMIFDADTPHQYPGVLLAAQRHPHLRTVWCRRGFWHRGFEEILPWADGFDAVLEPGDLVADQAGQHARRAASGPRAAAGPGHGRRDAGAGPGSAGGPGVVG